MGDLSLRREALKAYRDVRAEHFGSLRWASATGQIETVAGGTEMLGLDQKSEKLWHMLSHAKLNLDNVRAENPVLPALFGLSLP
jgi:hypothetical protein